MSRKLKIVTFLFFSPFVFIYPSTSIRDMNQYFNISTGFMYWNTLPLLLEYEVQCKQIHAFAIYLDLTTTIKYCETDKTYFCTNAFWNYKSANVGFAYKPRLVKWKNNSLRARTGMDMGVRQLGKFNLSLDVGIEYSHTFKNRLQLYITQKNDFVFWSRYHFKNGLLIGIKIPTN